MSTESRRGPSTITITVRWGAHILACEQLQRGGAFDMRGHDGRWSLPEAHPAEHHQLIEWDQQGRPWLMIHHDFANDCNVWRDDERVAVAAASANGPRRLELTAGMSANLSIGALTFDLVCHSELAPVLKRPRLPWRSWAIHAGVAWLAVGGLYISQRSAPDGWNQGGREAEREALAHHYLVRAEERLLAEAESEQVAEQTADRREGGTGARAKGQEGSMGASPYRVGNQRYGVAGPAHKPGLIARQHSLHEAQEFGMVGLLNSGAGGASAPWGRDGSTGSVMAPGGYQDHGVNRPVDPNKDRVSTFAIDVDTGSYTLARRQIRLGDLPEPGSVRAEEFINYFHYDYPGPSAQKADSPLATHVHAAPSPYEPGHQLVRVALQAKRPTQAKRKPIHLVYLVDTSGSMQSPDKLGLAIDSLRMLTNTLNKGDTVALCTYAGSTSEVLKPTDASNKAAIEEALNAVRSGGGTAMQSGMAIAYKLASDSYVPGHVNRVVVLSDGDANIGPMSPQDILHSIKAYRDKGITLSTIGFGTGNYRDAMMEQLADAGNGNYSYIDTPEEARRVFSEQAGSLLEVVARDVKVQVEFDPSRVASYRLIGYENRDVADKDFRKDDVDGGEVGMGHSVTALYDVVLRRNALTASQGGWVTVRVRYKQPEGNAPASETVVKLDERDVADSFAHTEQGFQLAVAVGGFAEILRDSPHAKRWQLSDVAAVASQLHSGTTEVAELRGLIANARQQREL